jgi:TetR/AcrR family transcriptional regulator, transcriptional repressor for nem operon
MGRPRGFDEDQVVRAAAELFARHSYDGTSVDDLVNHLGVHRGSLYKTFGSKRGLYLQALRRHVDEDVAALARAVAGADDQAEAVGLVLAAGPKLGLLFHAMVERAPVDPDAAAEATRALALLDAATQAEGLTALALGQLLRRRVMPSPTPGPPDGAENPPGPSAGGQNPDRESRTSDAPAQREGEPSWHGSASPVTT